MSIRPTSVWLLALLLAMAGSADAGFDEAMGHYRAKRWESAAAEFAKLVEQDDGYHPGHFMLGVCLLEQGEVDLAIRSLEKAIALDGKQFPYLNALATAQLRQKRYQRALEALDRAAPLAASNRDKLALHRSRARAAMALGRYQDAAQSLAASQAIQRTPALDVQLGYCYLQLDQLERAIATLQRADGTELTVQLYLAEAHLRQARRAGTGQTKLYQQALSHARAATRAQPSDPRGWRRLGEAQMATESFADAASSFQRALKLDPGNCPSRVNLGLSHYELADWTNAAAALSRAARCAPDQGVLSALAFSQLKLGQLERSLATYRSAYAKGRSERIAEAIALVERKLEGHEQAASDRQAEEKLERSQREQLEEYRRKQEAWTARTTNKGG